LRRLRRSNSTPAPAIGSETVFDNILGLALAAASIVYLTYAMLRPEKF
jgi:K+-transporting ATPase KdpF subunit